MASFNFLHNIKGYRGRGSIEMKLLRNSKKSNVLGESIVSYSRPNKFFLEIYEYRGGSIGTSNNCVGEQNVFNVP